MARMRGDLPSLSGAPWLTRGDTRAVLQAIETGGYEARVVGGAVRNALMGRPVKDIDLATTAEPADVQRLAGAAGLKVVPTGLAHGTVTVIAGHTPYEVTTLRRDIETFGRHARVTFTTDWEEDARRRDFTINALYCSRDGTLHDPLGGYPDIAAGRVRFIGDAHERIREDYLRILRFFRFSAEYTAGDLDSAGLAACGEMKEGLDALSGERIRAELVRLLTAPRAAQTLTVMRLTGVLEHVLGRGADTNLATSLVGYEEALDLTPDPIRRLGALVPHRPETASALRERLKLSNAEYERLARMALRDRAFDPATPEHEAKVFLYRHGVEAFRDGVLLAWAESGAPPSDTAWRARFRLPERWTTPELPIRGSDVVALGVPAGPAVGRALSAFEEWWIGAGFPADPELLASALSRAAMVTRT